MAEELGVSHKTVRRDLATFQEAGFPLEEVVEDFGRKRWRIDPARSQPGLSFAFDEAVALYLARRLMEPLAGTPFWEAAQRGDDPSLAPIAGGPSGRNGAAARRRGNSHFWGARYPKS